MGNECKNVEYDLSKFTHNCTQQYIEHMIMLQTIGMEQVKEALDQFNRVCTHN